MIIANEWQSYALLDAGDGEKLERWGEYILRRPDPQAIWPKSSEFSWDNADAHYQRSRTGGGSWRFNRKMPTEWEIHYKELRFIVQLMGFKHTGLFPEQASNWEYIIQKIQNAKRPIKLLNLFAYTGGASVAAAYAGAEVCHVDAAKGMVTRAKENLMQSKLSHQPVRFITDDVFKFVEREQRRGNLYDAIVMDPPSYGRGPKGEVWKIEDELFELIGQCAKILSPHPLFFLVNAYTTGFSPYVVENCLKLQLKHYKGGNYSSGELGLSGRNRKIVLPCGIFSRWEAS